MKFGIDRLLADPALRKPLEGKRVALVAHPASVTADLTHSLDALIAAGLNVTSAFGPQHGLKGDKQDNMVETADETRSALRHPGVQPLWRSAPPQRADDVHRRRVPVRPAGPRLPDLHLRHHAALSAGGRIGDRQGVWVLDRPNPAGRPVEGTLLLPGQESFVGAGPMPMRHGLTMGEMGRWFIDHFKLDVDYRVIAMEGWQPEGPGFGWPESRIWINPSPNAANLNMARAYAGTVMLEGATLSEGGAPPGRSKCCSARPMWMPRRCWPKCSALRRIGWRAARLRECWFEPTFHKHARAAVQRR